MKRLLFALLLACPVPVWAADTKISALSDGDPALTGDQIPVNRAGANFRITPGSIFDLGVARANAWTSTNQFNSNVYFGGATTAFPTLIWQTLDTPDTLVLGLGTTSRALVLVEAGDEGFDFAHAQQTNPTLFIHSAAQSTTQWLGLTHDGTNGAISVGTGSVLIPGAGANSVRIGPSAASAGANGIAIGNGASAAQTNSISIGTSACNHQYSFCIGAAAAATASGQVVMANTTIAMTDVYFGKGVAHATAVGYTIHGTGGSGTDNAGGGVAIAPGIGTGTAVGGQVVLQRNQTNTTGSAAQTLLPAWVSCPTKILSNTSATAQTIATITTTNTTGGAIRMFYTVVASDGTLVDADSGEVQTAWNNNAGTVAATMAAAIGGANSVASGTLASNPTATVATNVVSLKLTPIWTVITPTLVTGFATFEVNGVNSIVCQ